MDVYYNQLARTATLYVGNLSFYTTEEQIYELFSQCSVPGFGIKRVIMGLDRNSKTPCGFCFVEYYKHSEAVMCMRYISGTKLDERFIRCDLDPGYRDGRQYGRGRSGGQVRDEYRQEYDAGRGGWGHARVQEEEDQRRREEQIRAVYGAATIEGLPHADGDQQRIIPLGAEGEYHEEHAQARGHAPESQLKRARSEDQDGDGDDARKEPRMEDE